MSNEVAHQSSCLKFIGAVDLCGHAVVACENIRFSSLFATGDVSRGGTSATQ